MMDLPMTMITHSQGTPISPGIGMEEFQALRDEVASLRKVREKQSETEETLIDDLQRKCNKIIELEVLLDQERERANRLERAREEEEEALTGELRDIMANVGTTPDSSLFSSTVPSSGLAFKLEDQAAHGDEDDNASSAGKAPRLHGMPTQPATENCASRAETAVTVPTEGVAGNDCEEGQRHTGCNTWSVIHIDQRGRDSPTSGSSTQHGSPQEVVPSAGGIDTPDPALSAGRASTPSKMVQADGVVRGGSAGVPQGALRARVVELELQRQEATDALKRKTDESVRLEVQVEQLKSVVQSLSHATPVEQDHVWDESLGASTRDPRAMDTSLPLREISGLDPSITLQLLRAPWAEGMSEGVRSEEMVFEWQGRSSRGEWTTRATSLPAELSSLPLHHPAGISSSDVQASSLQIAPNTLAGKPSSRGGRSSSPPWNAAQPGVPAASRGEEGGTGDGAAGGVGGKLLGLRDRIGGAVAGLGGVAAAVGGGGLEGGAWGRASQGESLVTDEAVTMRFILGDVQLPSNQWEWVGGWMVDSETDATTDADGWVYGRDPREILEIASGKCNPVALAGRGALDDEGAGNIENDKNGSGRTVDVSSSGDRVLAGDGIRNFDEEIMEVRVDVGLGKAKSEGVSRSNRPTRGRRAVLRRRRLVRLRMVTRVDGAREATRSFLEMMRRVCSLEILVRKLSCQVVSLQRQVTAREGQIAFLAPLEFKLRQACAMGRRDHQRGNALQRRLIEAENELKVLKRCVTTTSLAPCDASAPVGPVVVPPNPRDVTLGERRSELPRFSPGNLTARVPSDAMAGLASRVSGPPEGGRGAGTWGWGGWSEVAQRAAESLTRRPPPPSAVNGDGETVQENANA